MLQFRQRRRKCSASARAVGQSFGMARGTRGSLVAALVSAFLLGVLIWWRDEHPQVSRATGALTSAWNATARTVGGGAAAFTGRSVAPAAVKDRSAELGPEVEALNQQLLPLIAQCLARAKQRGVRGRGMLALAVKLAGAKGIGRVIESVEPAPNSVLPDAELLDCVRQSAFTVDLPPPASSGSSEILLAIPFEGAPDAGAPSSP
jgi:hypothetical protein